MIEPFSYYKYPKAMRVIAKVFGVIMLLGGILSVSIWIDIFDSTLPGILVDLVLTGFLVYLLYDAAFSKVSFDGETLSWVYGFPRKLRLQEISEIRSTRCMRRHFMNEGIFVLHDRRRRRQFIRVYHLNVITALERLSNQLAAGERR